MKVKNNLLFIFFSLLIFSILFLTLLTNGMWTGHDWVAHFQRMISLNNELANNQYPPLFDYWSKGQFGYSWQLFYPPLTSLLFLIASALTFNSPDIIIQMKTVFFIIMVIAFAASFYAARREHNSVPAGYLCAFLFISSGYFLTNIYIRFALGECLAMAVMPLFLRGCSSLISDREDRWLIPFSALMIFLSNIPSLIVTAIFFILFFIINFKALLSKDNVRFFIISALFVLSLSAFYWVPLLYHMHYSDIFATSGKLLKYEDLLKFSSGLIETLLSLPSTYGVSNPGMFLSIGVIQLILALFYLKYGRSPYAKKMIIVALVFIFATTHFIPWNLIPDSVPILKLMQFPWRLLSCATAIVALYTSGMLAGQLPRKRALVFAVVLFSIAGMYLPVKKAVTHRFLQLDTSSLYDDYLNNSNIRPVNFRHLEKNDFAFFVNKQAPIVSTRFVNGYPELQIRADGEQVATLPYIMYSGYYLLVDGKPTDTVRLDNGLVGVRLGAGEHTVRLAYRRSIVVIPGLVSLLSLGVTAFFFSRRRRSQASAALAE